MMRAAHAGALALPRLHEAIPMAFRLPGRGELTAPLAIALLEANLITDKMLGTPPNALPVDAPLDLDARDLSARALTDWWSSIQYPSKYFRWDLHVQELNDLAPRNLPTTDQVGWFCLTRNDDFALPRFALGRRIGELEVAREGFGQTVMAILLQATLRLPDALDPWRAHGIAEWLHWGDTETDNELLEAQREERGYITTQQVIDDDDIMTRAQFYGDMPVWVTNPGRVLSADDMRDAARDDRDRAVAGACAAISDFIHRAGARLAPHAIGSHQVGCGSIEGCMVLLWAEGDQIGRVIDDGLEMIGESGDYVEFIDAHPTPLTKKGIRAYQDRTEKMMRLAALTERLLDLIGDPL